ncbi:tautomerase [Cupriavidus sp. USMAA2-4]|uniref:tautomerase n=1 Tax=unclassified Cupriavidus TaxID=2640874 RepID=UPI0008A6A251|nr:MULTISPECIES: tautomerase [unclassified Cupriavidus]AOY96019.1 tautomerase [Cupriavidus sp. USMAA2-4]AOZ03546.1 tautomerase [Cupriavidus sp. USMAHM13]
MPNLLIRIPQGTFPGTHRADLGRLLSDAAATAERIPDDPRRRALCWVQVEEVAAGGWTCGGADPGAGLLPCVVQACVPAGVLDDAARAEFVRLVHEAVQAARPAGDTRPLVTSVLLQEVPDGTWGVNGRIWRLADFAAAAGYAHLQQASS